MKRFDQYCPLAHALSLVGERWSLLIVRDLLTGPKRYTDLAQDRKSTRLNSSHLGISYAVFCLKKKTKVRLSRKQALCDQAALSDKEKPKSAPGPAAGA